MRKLLTAGAVSLAMTVPLAAQAEVKQLKNYAAISFNVVADFEEEFNGATTAETDSGTGFRIDGQYFISNSIAVIGRFSQNTHEREGGGADIDSDRIEIGARAFLPFGTRANGFVGVTVGTINFESASTTIDNTNVAAQLGASGLITNDISVWGLVKIGAAYQDDQGLGGASTEFEIGGSYRFFQNYAAHLMYNYTELDVDRTVATTVQRTSELSTISIGVSYLF